MLSDGRNIGEPLEKEHCEHCGLIRHASPPSQEEVEAIFSRDYALHDRLIDNIFEDQRQRIYADWILSLLGDRRVNSIFEIGAGTGSLMAELRRRAPQLRLKGVEPVSSAVSRRAEGLDIECGLLRDINTAVLRVDVVLSVNVIEHVHNPVEFLQQSRTAIADGGCIVTICPDGDRPTTEMLVYDHIHSFTSHALERIAQRAGLAVADKQLAPAALGAFQAVVLVPGSGTQISVPLADALYSRRVSFLRDWQRLDEALLDRVRNVTDLFAFGSGENAQLLRAYAPRTWEMVCGILADSEGSFDGRPVTLYSGARTGKRRTVLLAVRPEIQENVANRLTSDGNIVIRWDDLVRSEG